jgi:hypothetical protein
MPYECRVHFRPIPTFESWLAYLQTSQPGNEEHHHTIETFETSLIPLVYPGSAFMEDVLQTAKVDGMDGVDHETVFGPVRHDGEDEAAAARNGVDSTPFLGEDRHTPELWTERSLPFQQYIARANKRRLGGLCLRICGSAETTGKFEPTLGMGSSNCSIVFAGCFNPPHRGHMELLCHAFLRTDTKTVAAILIPTDDNCRMPATPKST